MYEPLSAIYPDLGEAGSMFFQRPDPKEAVRPYGFLSIVGEPPSPLAGETECTFAISYFGKMKDVGAFADSIAWIDGYTLASHQGARGLRYRRDSRVVTEEAGIRGAWQLVDTVTCRYLHVGRLETVM